MLYYNIKKQFCSMPRNKKGESRNVKNIKRIFNSINLVILYRRKHRSFSNPEDSNTDRAYLAGTLHFKRKSLLQSALADIRTMPKCFCFDTGTNIYFDTFNTFPRKGKTLLNIIIIIY